ncbi:MAG: hypothetical protein J6Z12_00345 [Paludibacteraceae bacterium]|nr:hypothetical protein [Paludibacteraceae bacterium]
MKKILLLLAIAIGLTSCPAKPHDGNSITIVKFTHEDYAAYVMGVRCADSVETYKSSINNDNQPIKLISLCDGWWYINATNVQFDKDVALGEMTWNEFNSLPKGGKNPAVSALKDPHPCADITEILLNADIGVTHVISEAFYQTDSSSIVVRLREIIANGQLDDYRCDWRYK